MTRGLQSQHKPQFEIVEYEGDTSIRTLRRTTPHFISDWHFHPEFEIACVLQSDGIRFVGDSVEPYAPLDLILLGPGLPHCWQDQPDADGAEQACELLVIQFKRGTFGETFLGIPDNREIDTLLNRASRGLVFSQETAVGIHDLLIDVVESHGSMRIIRLLECLHHMAVDRKSVTLASRGYSPDSSAHEDRRVITAVQYIKENFRREIVQSEVANLVGLTPQSFSRFFKSATGVPFRQFVNSVRVALVCRLLITTDQSVATIAFDCGYGNLSNFNRRFKDAKGMSPRKYRQLYRELFSDAA